MTVDEQKQNARDRKAFERLRMYFRLNFADDASDGAFLKWCADMVKQAARDWQAGNARIDIPADVEAIYTCPTCGAHHEDGGRGKPPVYCDECGADWKDSTT
jgi:hypothetical protein